MDASSPHNSAINEVLLKLVGQGLYVLLTVLPQLKEIDQQVKDRFISAILSGNMYQECEKDFNDIMMTLHNNVSSATAAAATATTATTVN